MNGGVVGAAPGQDNATNELERGGGGGGQEQGVGANDGSSTCVICADDESADARVFLAPCLCPASICRGCAFKVAKCPFCTRLISKVCSTHEQATEDVEAQRVKSSKAVSSSSSSSRRYRGGSSAVASSRSSFQRTTLSTLGFYKKQQQQLQQQQEQQPRGSGGGSKCNPPKSVPTRRKQLKMSPRSQPFTSRKDPASSSPDPITLSSSSSSVSAERVRANVSVFLCKHGKGPECDECESEQRQRKKVRGPPKSPSST